MRFAWAPLEAICEASGLDVALLKDTHEDNVVGLIEQWYAHHRAQGGEPDPTMEQLHAEVQAELDAGVQAHDSHASPTGTQ